MNKATKEELEQAIFAYGSACFEIGKMNDAITHSELNRNDPEYIRQHGYAALSMHRIRVALGLVM